MRGHHFVLILLALVFLALGPRNAPADNTKWMTYTDPSYISEIDFIDGKFYMATWGGLVIFDPADSSFEQITNLSGLQSNFLNCMTVDSNGVFWVGTDDAGIAKMEFDLDGVLVKTFSAEFNGVADNRVTTITSWGDSIFYGTKAGAGIIYQDFPSVRYFERDGLPSESINDVLADGDYMWIATDEGVAILDPLGFIHEVSTGLPDLRAFVFAQSDNELWVGTGNGVAQFNPADSTWTDIGPAGREIFSLFYDGSELWGGWRQLLFQYDGIQWRSYNVRLAVREKYQLGFQNTEISTIYRQPDGTVLFSMGDAVDERRGSNLVAFDLVDYTYIKPNTPSGNDIRRLSLDGDGSLWYSTGSFGVGKLSSSGTFVVHNNSIPGGTELTDRLVNNALLCDSRGNKWFGFRDTLDALNDKVDDDYGNDEWAHINIDEGGGDGLGTLAFVKAREDPAGNRWFLSDAFSAFNFGDHPDEEGIHILSADSSEWRRVTPVTTSGKLKRGDIYDVAYHSDGSVYIANYQFGVQLWITNGYDKDELFDFSADAWITIAEAGDEIPGGTEILSLALRSDNVLWIGTNDGLFKYSGSPNLKHIRANRGFGNGLLGSKVADLVLDENENLWVATDYGLNRIDRDDDNDIMSFTTPVAWQQELNLFFPLDVISPLVNADCRSLAYVPENNLLYIATAGGISSFDVSGLDRVTKELNTTFLYPNPVNYHQGDRELMIGNIFSDVVVEIYNTEGELVDRTSANQSGDVVWDLLTQEGFIVASGMYFVRISNDQGHVVKSIAVIR